MTCDACAHLFPTPREHLNTSMWKHLNAFKLNVEYFSIIFSWILLMPTTSLSIVKLPTGFDWMQHLHEKYLVRQRSFVSIVVILWDCDVDLRRKHLVENNWRLYQCKITNLTLSYLHIYTIKFLSLNKEVPRALCPVKLSFSIQILITFNLCLMIFVCHSARCSLFLGA